MEEKVVQKLQRDVPTDSCKEALRVIDGRLAAGTEVFMALKGRIDLLDQDNEHIWEWKRTQNGDFKTLKEKIFAMDKEAEKNSAILSEKLAVRLDKQLEKQKVEIEALVKPVCEAVGILQKGADAKSTVREFKSKVAENSLKYLVGGAGLVLSLWKIYELVKGALAVSGN